MSEKKTITWVTPDYFVDCDFNVEILKSILLYYNIHWLILLPAKNARFSEAEFKRIERLQGIKLEFIYWNKRARNPKMLFFYEQVFNRIKALNADLVYFNYVPTSPYVLPLYWRLPANKTIVTAHDGNVKPSFNKAWIAKVVFKLAFSTKKYVNTFSPSEARLFKAGFKKNQLFTIPLGLKDFGTTQAVKRSDAIVFLFFGSIHSNKNLELLIAAGNQLYKEGLRGFKIAIKGACTNWPYYQQLIQFPEAFECDIRLHDNDEIPKIFTEAHYSVFPYKHMSQSGALKAALNYNSPVIVSDLEGFTNEITHQQNGFIFKSDQLNELVNILKERIYLHPTHYQQLSDQVAAFNLSNFGNAVQADKYVAMFNEVLSNER